MASIRAGSEEGRLFSQATFLPEKNLRGRNASSFPEQRLVIEPMLQRKKKQETEENTEVKNISARREEERCWAGRAESGCWVGFQSKVLIYRPTLSENGNLKFDQNTDSVEAQNALSIYRTTFLCPKFPANKCYRISIQVRSSKHCSSNDCSPDKLLTAINCLFFFCRPDLISGYISIEVLSF